MNVMKIFYLADFDEILGHILKIFCRFRQNRRWCEGISISLTTPLPFFMIMIRMMMMMMTMMTMMMMRRRMKMRKEEGKRGQLIILSGLSGLNRRAKTGNLPLWLIYKCFRVTTQISYTDLQKIYKLQNSKYGKNIFNVTNTVG